MPQVKKKLSEIQFRVFLDAQLKYNEGLESVALLEQALLKIRALVFDAVGIPVGTDVQIDTNAQELVFHITEPDKKVNEKNNKDK